MQRHGVVCVIALAVVCSLVGRSDVLGGAKRMTNVEVVLKETAPLKFPRGARLPLYVWGVKGPGSSDEATIEKNLKALDERGLAMLASWHHGRFDKSLASALLLGKIQKKLGLRVNVDATAVTYSFCNGDEATAHVDKDGNKFFDMSFASYRKMGCPFALQSRYKPMKAQLEPFLKAYQENDVPLGFWAVDWEIDGPIEWNEAWAHSKRCVRCRENVKNIDDFAEFQTALRKIRADIQQKVFCDTIKQYFPEALIGNYGVYPHNGSRYWFDYFEKFVEGAPFKADHQAKNRQWAHTFKPSGYTFSMPVVYTWFPIYGRYSFQNKQYRWFYNMLLVASNAGQHTPAETPIIPFVHWSTTDPPKELPEGFEAMSEECYQELLWHMLLRGHDTFCMWCPSRELAVEVRPLHKVYAASLEYKEFLDKGQPMRFDVPSTPGPVVSALRLDGRLLVRRTDFDETAGAVVIKIDGKDVSVPRAKGRCQAMNLK